MPLHFPPTPTTSTPFPGSLPPLSTTLCGAPPSPAPGGEWCPSPFAAPGVGRISLGREVGWGCAYGVSCLTCGGKMGLGLPGVLYLRFGGVWGGSQGEVLWMTGVGGASGVPWGYHLGQVWCMSLSRGRDWGSPGGVCVQRESWQGCRGISLTLGEVTPVWRRKWGFPCRGIWGAGCVCGSVCMGARACGGLPLGGICGGLPLGGILG